MSALMTAQMRHLDLFAGIVGFSLAARWMGWTTVAQVEWDEWCQKVLAKNFPDALRFGDIIEFNKMLERHEIITSFANKMSDMDDCPPEFAAIINDHFDELITETSNGKIIGYTEGAGKTEIREVFREGQGHKQSTDTIGVDTIAERRTGCVSIGHIDIITGGFPCQPFSHAGKRKGTDDSRYLWPAMLETIRRIKPAYVVGENVAGLVSMENGKTLDRILSDLEDEGYTTEQVIIPACAVGAWHRRDRIWIVAHSVNRADRTHGEQSGKTQSIPCECGTAGYSRMPCGTGGEVRHNATNCHNQGLQGRTETRDLGGSGKKRNKQSQRCDQLSGGENGATQSRLGGMAHGLPSFMDGYWDREPEGVPRVATGVKDRVNRLKGLGNAIVPQVALQIFKAIEQYELKTTEP